MTFSNINQEDLEQELQEHSANLNTLQANQQAKIEDEDQALIDAKREKELRENSHGALESKEFGLKENVQEVKNAVVGGLRDSASSILTAPERIVDMATGEMKREMQAGGYTPDWQPLGHRDEIATKTWWGSMLRTGIHFGSMAIPIVGWAGRASKATGAVGAISRATVANPNFIIQGASIGGISDLVSEYSQDANGLQILRDRYGFIDTPITTNDSDHPAVLTVKNFFEGLGIGTVADGIVRGLGRVRGKKGLVNNPTNDTLKAIDKIESRRLLKAEESAKIQVDTNLRQATIKKLFTKGIDFKKLTPEEQVNAMLKVQQADRSGRYTTWTPPGEDNIARADRRITQRSDSVENQRAEAGANQETSPFPGAYKSPDTHQRWQGAANSTGSPYTISKTLKRIHNEWGAELGSTDSLLTPAAAEVLATEGFGSKGITPQIAKELMGDARFRRLAEELRNSGRSLQDVYGDAFERFKEVMGGRDAGALEPDEFWNPLRKFAGSQGDFEVWAGENILAADLIQTSLFKQLRDRALVARELINIDDITLKDGPLKNIHDNLIVGMTQIKRSKFLTSPEYQDMIAQKGGANLVEDVLDQIHFDTKKQIDMMMDLARNNPSDEFLHALVEAFSMSNKIQNWQDFDGFMRGRLLGATTEEGVKRTGSLIRELQGVMVNSILSGPKTPLRAIMGTSTAVFTRPMSQTIGGLMRYMGTGFQDASVLREALAESNAMIQAVPEATEYFFSRLNSYWAGDISTIKNRFAEYSNSDDHWELVGNWAETRGTVGEKAAYRVANLARSANQSNFLTYSTKLMASTDDAFTLILARGRSRSKALREAMDAQAHGLIPDVNPELIRNYQNRFYQEIFDPNTGTVSDSWLRNARAEATLTKDLSGFGKSLDQLFGSNPLLKPFYLFARTGINGLNLTIKHTPLGVLTKEFNDIAFANPEDLVNVAKYGIENIQDLRNARALQNGRIALGSSMIFMAGQKYLNGELTGNGPADNSKRRLWMAAGWRPRSIKLGNVWVSHESLEPFTSILSSVADYGDNQSLMGDEWVEKGLLSNALIISKAMVSKTYLQGFQGMTDLFGRNPKQLEKIAANILNNTIPLAGLRNEIGKVVNPYMKELNSGFTDSLRNRNQAFELLANEELPVKYDLLTGRPINDWDPLTRLFNAVSPVSLNFDQAPGRKFLFRSNYDLSISTYTSPDGDDLRSNAQVRSKFQRAIGNQNLEKQLAKLALRKDVQESIRLMEEDIASGRANRPPGISPMSYQHNKLIHQLIVRAKGRAWAQIMTEPDVQHLRSATTLEKAAKNNRITNPKESNRQYDQATQLLEMTNK
jgi:hypothetical protein